MERGQEHTEPVEGILQQRFARGEIDAQKYERSLKLLANKDAATQGRATKLKLLAGGLTAAALLTVVGGGVALAQDESTNSTDNGTGSTDNGMGSMHGSGMTCPMMQGGGMSSMHGGDSSSDSSGGMSSMHGGSSGMGSMMGSMMGGNHNHGTSDESTSDGS